MESDKEFYAFLNFFATKANFKKALVISPEDDVKLVGKSRCDYIVLIDKSSGYYFELSRVIDRADLYRSNKWALTVNLLKKLIITDENYHHLKGLYDIQTPNAFGIDAGRLKNEKYIDTKIRPKVKELLQAVVRGETEFVLWGSKLQIKNFGGNDKNIIFGTIGPGGSYSPADRFYQNVRNKLPTANKQLGHIYNKIKRTGGILLLLNRDYLLTWDWEIYDGISFFYEELEKYKNIDQIWLQTENRDKTYSYRLLYKKSFFEAIKKGHLNVKDKDEIALFANWFSPLEKKGDEFKKNLKKILFQFIGTKEPLYKIFPDTNIRINMVKLGEWLIENGDIREAETLIGAFISDPDTNPAYKKSEAERYLKELDKEVITGKDVSAIATVKAHLAWVVQKLALQKNTLVKAYTYTQSVLRKTKSLYTIESWFIPLIEIAAKRVWLEENSKKLYLDFRKLTLYELLPKYSKYRGIARYLIHVFYYFRDLSSDEVRQVLDYLKHHEESDVLIVYFALFREDHYKDSKYSSSIRKYTSQYSKGVLDSIIKAQDKTSENLRSGIAWQFWKILREDKSIDTFKKLKPWIEQFVIVENSRRIESTLLRIIEELIAKDEYFDISIEWFEKIINKLENTLKDNPQMFLDVWIDTDEIIEAIAKKNPKKLSIIINQLVNLWKANVFVGDLKRIFTVYKLISNKKIKESIKKELIKHYKNLKKIKSNIVVVDFN